MKEMMKEVVVVEPHKYEVREVPVPELANEDEVLIQMKSAGVCGSDHHIYHGSNPLIYSNTAIAKVIKDIDII